MPGADIVTASVDDQGKTQIYDRYATGYYMPSLDDCQNWVLINGQESQNKTIVEVF